MDQEAPGHVPFEVTKTPRPKAQPVVKPSPKVEKEVEKLKKDKTPEEQAQLDQRVNDILKFF